MCSRLEQMHTCLLFQFFLPTMSPHRIRKSLDKLLQQWLLLQHTVTCIFTLPSTIEATVKDHHEPCITVNSGILCLDSEVITILGGLVQSLYDEWQKSKKYSGFSRTSLKFSQNIDSVGPPPFQRLQIESCSSQFTGQHSLNSSYSRQFAIVLERCGIPNEIKQSS